MTISQDEVYLTCIINYITIKMKNKNIYHTDGTVPISNQKIIETDKIYTTLMEQFQYQIKKS